MPLTLEDLQRIDRQRRQGVQITLPTPSNEGRAYDYLLQRVITDLALQGRVAITIHPVEAPPGEDVGAPGDFALWPDETAPMLYGPKTDETTWPEGVPLRGAQGPAGQDGADGAQGEPGDPGQDGRTIHAVTGAPSAGLGNDGDLALDTTTDPDVPTLYGPKAAGAWPAGIPLRGPQGPAGADGADGADGPPGAYTAGHGIDIDGDVLSIDAPHYFESLAEATVNGQTPQVPTAVAGDAGLTLTIPAGGALVVAQAEYEFRSGTGAQVSAYFYVDGQLPAVGSSVPYTYTTNNTYPGAPTRYGGVWWVPATVERTITVNPLWSGLAGAQVISRNRKFAARVL